MIYFLTVNYYSTDLVNKLINSISASKNLTQKTVVINNSPDDRAIYQLKTDYVIILEAGSNLGFSKACNLGLKWIYTQEPQAIVWLINPDAYLINNCLEQVIPFFEVHPELSIVGTIIYTSKGQVWFAGGCFIPQTGVIVSQDLLTNTNTAYVSCDWVSGCSLLINLRKFHECPLFDTAYFLYYEDFDFCRKYVNQGHLIGVTKQISVIHQPSTITNKNVLLKFKYSTYSYLLTVERYTNKFILAIRLTKLMSYAFILIMVKPKVGFGKLYGVLLYLRRTLPF